MESFSPLCSADGYYFSSVTLEGRGLEGEGDVRPVPLIHVSGRVVSFFKFVILLYGLLVSWLFVFLV